MIVNHILRERNNARGIHIITIPKIGFKLEIS